MDKLLLKASDVSEMTGLGKSKTYALIAAGVIPSVRIGKCVRVPLERLRRWIAALHVNEQTPLPLDESIPVPPLTDDARTVKRPSQNPQKSRES